MVGIVEMPSTHIVQSSPLASVLKCLAIKDEIHLVTVNPRIGISFVHVLSGKKQEVDPLPAFMTEKIADAKSV